ASAALTELRGQDEPFWTAMTLVILGATETTLGRYDSALNHLDQLNDLAQQFGNTILIAIARVRLGTLAVMRGRLDEASTLLQEGLNLSLAISDTRKATLSLAAFAQLAFAEGDPEQSALLAGAADGVRRRAGLRPWPMMQRVESDLVTQVRKVLGTGRFDELFGAGAQLSQREAAAAAIDRRDAR